MRLNVSLAAIGAASLCIGAQGNYTVTQGASAPTYDTLLTFDEAGGPVGSGLPSDSWLADFGVTIAAGDGNQVVDDFSGSFPWINDGNAFFGNFGVFMNFESDLTAASFQVWDPSGAPTPFGGGLGIFLFDDGVPVYDAFVEGLSEPAWGGLGDEWFNITTDGGMVFDEIRVVGLGFDPFTYVDNVSWNSVPAPGALALLGIAGLAGRRRRN